MTIAFFILLFLVFVVLAIDFVPQFNTWQSRIHIGRWQDKDAWQKKISGKSLQWLKNTPTIKLTDNNRLIVIDMLRGTYKRNAIQHWQQAALLLGLISAFEKTGGENIKRQIRDFIDSKMDASGNWKQAPKEVDGVILAYAMLKADWIDHQKYKSAYDAIWKLVQDLTGADGTVQYRKHMKDFRYVDTIGFICPFLIRYGTLFNNDEATLLACRQIAEYEKKGMYPGQFIPCHTYNVSSGMPAGLFGWGRGLGWYAIGLIDAWMELPVQHPNKKALTDSVAAFAKTVLAFQNPKGGWNWIIMNEQAVTDSSTTATLAYFLTHASGIAELHEECILAKEKAIQYLMKVTRRDGAIDLSQGDTKGIGIYSQEFDILPFTQGFALRTICAKG
jgi:unsaturated rhamnogalacturonyl hydrolase